MKVFKFIAILFAVVFITNAARAEQKIGVVDTRILLSKSKASEDVAKQLTKIRDKVLKDLTNQEKSLREEEQAIIKSREKSSEEDFVKKAKAFEEKRIAFQKVSEDYRRRVNEATFKAEQKISESITQSVSKVADEEGYDLVLTKQNVIIGSKDIDITDQVMKALNKDLPKLKVEYSDK